MAQMHQMHMQVVLFPGHNHLLTTVADDLLYLKKRG